MYVCLCVRVCVDRFFEYILCIYVYTHIYVYINLPAHHMHSSRSKTHMFNMMHTYIYIGIYVYIYSPALLGHTCPASSAQGNAARVLKGLSFASTSGVMASSARIFCCSPW